MEIRDLRFFCLAAELEHVSNAADKLGVTQPYLSKIIRQLEKEVGTPLFDNLGRRIKLNQFGELLYPRAKKILNDIDALYADIDHALDQHERTITILSDAEAYSSDIVLGYKKAHPDCALSFTFKARKEITESLIIGTTDFALTTPPIDSDPSKGIVTDIVLCERACALLPPGHRLLGRESVSLEDLKGEPLVTSPRGAGMRSNIDMIFSLYDFHAPIVCETNNVDLQIRAVSSGMGYAWMPRMLMRRDPELSKFSVDLDTPEATGYVGLSYNINANKKSKGDDFREFIKDYFSTLSKSFS
ncbi:MAG: LysR family transcriptional regulator [Clostridiales bacterium]|jgi:DNA-binding transcriptional LysR family regulator|nr:LysR family transcriptional regulator [Clostridiales bacterium]